MKRRGFLMIITMSIIILFNTINAQGKRSGLFDDIIDLTDGTIEEVGVRLSFNTENRDKDILHKIYEDLNIKDIDTVEMAKDHGHDNLIFSGKKISGTIENIPGSSWSTIIISITEKSEHNDVNELKDMISKSLSESYSNIKYFYSIKAKLSSDDILGTNNKLLNFLKDTGSTNLDTINISNGYSTVAYTKLFDPIYIIGTPVDFNYAVITYDTGTYIVLGTPIISIPY